MVKNWLEELRTLRAQCYEPHLIPDEAVALLDAAREYARANRAYLLCDEGDDDDDLKELQSAAETLKRSALAAFPEEA